MALSISLLLFTTILSFLPGLYDCSHVARHMFRQHGTFKTPLGPRKYNAVSELKMPVVPWAELAADGIKIAECSETSMTFEGKIDPEDFAVQVVIAIPKKLYASLGCPLPSASEDVLDREQIVFREIVSAARRNRFMTVQTRFVSGKKVVPKTTLEIGSLVASEENQVSSNRQFEDASDDSIATTSRVGILGLNNVKRSTSFNLTENVKIDVEATFSGGICDIVFDQEKDTVDVLLTLSADLLATLTLEASFSNRQSGVLLKEGLPDLGVSLDLELLGRASIGILVALEYVAELDLNADLSASFSASYSANSTVSLGFLSSNAQRMGESVGQRSASLNPKFQVDAANFSASGFIGLRPEIEAELELPIIGEAGVKFGGTVGLEAKAEFVEPPFAPIAGRTDSCGSCHQVGGTLDLVGRRLSVTALFPFVKDQEFILANRMFDISIAEVCFYTLSCPGTIEDEREQCISSAEIEDAVEDLQEDLQDNIADQAESINDILSSQQNESNALSQAGGVDSEGGSQVAGLSSEGGLRVSGVSSADGSPEGGVSSEIESQGGGVSSGGGSQGGGVGSEVMAPPADGPTVMEEGDDEEDEKSGSESSDKSGSEKSDSEKSGSEKSDSDSDSDKD